MWFLTATILALSLADTGLAFQNEPEGFRGLKWGDPPRENMELIDEHKDGTRGYGVPNDRPHYLFEIGDVSLTGIVYIFRPQPERLMWIYFFFEGEENYSRLETICRQKFGKTIEKKAYDMKWLGTTSWIHLNYDSEGEKGFLIFGSRILLEDWLGASQKKQTERVEKTRVASETKSVFWMSISEGLLILRHWQVWVAVILYMAINLAFLMIISIATIGKGDQSGGRMAMGCLFHTVGGAVLHALLMGSMVAFLLPILLGGTSATPISAIVSLLWPIVKAGVIAIVVVTILAFIPLIGQLIADSPGIHAFLEGVIILRVLSGYAIDQILTEADVQGIVYPGFWESIGFLVIAGVLVRVVMFGVALLSVPLKDTTGGELMTMTVGPVLGVLGGIIPLFMYSSYIRLSIMQLIG